MEKIINWAIVIPTWREERFIGKLLDSLSSQTILPQEIVVVDAYSDDKTKAEVKKRLSTLKGLKFFQIPKQTIAHQRNFGVLKTKASNILFLDADVALKGNDTLEKYIKEVEKRKPDIALAQTLPDSLKLFDQIYYKIIFWDFFKIVRPIYPMATAMNLFIKRDVFLEYGGFNEKIRVGEDHDLVQRIAVKNRKLIFLNEPKFITSIRRIKKEGRVGYIIKSLRFGMHALRHGFSDAPNILYEFGEFNELDSKK